MLNESSSKSREKKPTNPKNSVRNRNHNVLKQLARIVLLDLPMAGILLGCASLAWLDHVHRSYLVPQIKALRWTPHRAATELTYYTRICDAADLTTRSSADLFLSLTATAQQAADHQLQHGFTVIQGVLSDETMTALRNHIDWRNRNEQSLYVIEGKHRASILLGTEAPVVREALEEIANHEQFRTSLEAMLGPNPALIEMTAISSSAGAVAQWWHADGT